MSDFAIQIQLLNLNIISYECNLWPCATYFRIQRVFFKIPDFKNNQENLNRRMQNSLYDQNKTQILNRIEGFELFIPPFYNRVSELFR